ncbi:hypothetical protein SLEP1_g42118 [Rubroshorea leprosula]|uniref:BHLH transcription factor n=1 Tax=Rubroshorea leprosula TaxID=152421 RepID=A0AAV5L8R2_9ROSI|nr:hypothetical protein SLEP1_g42118 [Rubroshorea leprosula]
MALEAIVYPQDPCGYGCKDLYTLLGFLGSEGAATGLHVNAREHSSPTGDPYSTPKACTAGDQAPQVRGFSSMESPALVGPESTTNNRRKRQRTRSSRNKEELENQRMTHITLERNRRKQMNDYLSVLKSLMPPSYVQRGDQASIIGGAINFVKELEQLLQSIEVNKRTTTSQQLDNNADHPSPLPFAEFFTFPQFSTRSTQRQNIPSSVPSSEHNKQEESEAADIEVSMMESHANVKILSKKRPRQLLKLVTALQSLRFSILHLNVTTADLMVLYTISLKVEEGCHLNTVEEIAAAVNQMLRTIQVEAAFS